ncbi:polymer-forming cytoskeletal protein, partial [uncultured Brevundimonas sp.]|uniref:polymer-forming cytoskeletal protein n=1 Tax=uncultured Brevundimonas sp. TaxID=213418 RepID=UPI00262C4661
ATAYVDGDVTAEQLSIDIGAYFQGRVLQGRREAPAAAAAPRPAAAPAAGPAPQIIDMKPGA